MRRKLLIMLAVLAVACWAPAALADICTFDLTAINDLSIGSGPFVQVQVNQTSGTTAMITATAYDPYQMGDGSAFGLNFNGPVSISGLTFYDPVTSIIPVTPGLPSPQNANPSGYTGYLANSPQNVDGWGDFSTVFSVQSMSADDNFEVITFAATLFSGTWASCANVLLSDVANGVYPAVAHVLNPTITGGAANTGFASVPLPPSVLLLGSGLLGLAGLGFRSRRRKS